MFRYPGEFAVDYVLPLLTKGSIIPIGHHQVDFTEAGIVIVHQLPEDLLFQPTTGGSFCPVAFNHWDKIVGPAEAGSAELLAAGEPASPHVSGTTLVVVGPYRSR